MVNTFTQEDGCPLPLVSFHRPYVVPGLLDAAERTIDGTICDISGGVCAYKHRIRWNLSLRQSVRRQGAGCQDSRNQ